MIKGIMSESLHIKGIMSKEFSAIRCLDFNGSTDYVDLGNPASLRPSSKLTLSAWFRLDDLIDINCIYANWISPANSLILLRTHEANLQCYISQSDHTQIGGTFETVIKNKWYKVKVIADGSNLNLYLDENKSATNYAYDGTLNDDATNNFYIGKYEGEDKYFGGKIANIKFGLVSNWLMREQKGNILHDSIGSNHGTIYGADWYEEKFNTPLKGIMSNSSEIRGIMTVEYP